MTFPVNINGVDYDEVDDLVREITRRAEDFVLPGRASTHPGAYFDRFRSDPAIASALDAACEQIVRAGTNGDAVALAVAITPPTASRTWLDAILSMGQQDLPDSRHYGSGAEVRRRALASLDHGIATLDPELFPRYRRVLAGLGALYEATLNAIKLGNDDDELLELAEAWGKSVVIEPMHAETAALWLTGRPELLVPFAEALAPATIEARRAFLTALEEDEPALLGQHGAALVRALGLGS